MRSSMSFAAVATLVGLLFTSPSTAQTWSACNPTKQSGCPADPALGGSVSVDFRNGASNEFTAQGAPTYNSDGAVLTVAKAGDAPTLVSKWYIMFGKYSVTMKAAPGKGIVSSLVLQSDDLDEIDWEWLGGSEGEVQSNYFGKGQTTTYDRAAVHAVTNSQSQWHTYSVEWTSTQIIWQIDGTTVRVLNAADANGQFPQTPMQLKIGAWSGGDPSNSPGTIQWAGGLTNYANGPFSMYVQSLSVVDYSTGKSYSYGDMSGSWQSIVSNGGKINGNSGGSAVGVPAPQITTTNSGQDTWDGTHRTNTASVTYTSYQGLPSGWTVSSSGKVVPPSAAPITSPSTPSTPSPSLSEAALCTAAGFKVVTSFDDRGFPTTATVPADIKTSWNDQGFPVTIYPSNCAAATPVPAVVQKQFQITAAAVMPSTLTTTPSATYQSMVPTGGSSNIIFSTTRPVAAGASGALWRSAQSLGVSCTAICAFAFAVWMA